MGLTGIDISHFKKPSLIVVGISAVKKIKMRNEMRNEKVFAYSLTNKKFSDQGASHLFY